MHFIRFLVKKGREDILDQIAIKFLELRDERQGIVNVDVQTAFDMSDQQKSELKTKLEQMLNKKVRFKIHTVPEVVGGFIAKVDDTVYDASVKHQLEILKRQFLKGGAALN